MAQPLPFDFDTTTGDVVRLGDLRAYDRITVTAPWNDEPGVTISAVLRLSGWVYVVEAIRVAAEKPDHPVTAEMLRRVPVGALVRRTVSSVITNANVSAILAPEPHAGVSREEASQLARVALYYRLGRLIGDGPTKYTQQRLGVSRATAVRRISAARQAGVLDADEFAPSGAPAAAWGK